MYNIARKTPKSPDLINPDVPERLAHIVESDAEKPHRRYKVRQRWHLLSTNS